MLSGYDFFAHISTLSVNPSTPLLLRVPSTPSGSVCEAGPGGPEPVSKDVPDISDMRTRPAVLMALIRAGARRLKTVSVMKTGKV